MNFFAFRRSRAALARILFEIGVIFISLWFRREHHRGCSPSRQETAKPEGCWLAGSRTARQGKRQGDTSRGRASRDMPCLPAGATTRLTFVRPVLRPGPAGTNETADLPTRGPACPAPNSGLYSNSCSRSNRTGVESGNSKQTLKSRDRIEICEIFRLKSQISSCDVVVNNYQFTLPYIL